MSYPYHVFDILTVFLDSSCRPGEILGLRIRDLHFKTRETKQYAEILVNGKTGPRSNYQ